MDGRWGRARRLSGGGAEALPRFRRGRPRASAPAVWRPLDGAAGGQPGLPAAAQGPHALEPGFAQDLRRAYSGLVVATRAVGHDLPVAGEVLQRRMGQPALEPPELDADRSLDLLVGVGVPGALAYVDDGGRCRLSDLDLQVLCGH